jgi:hypothetical protein
MRATVDRVTLWILLVVIGVTTAVVLTLQAIRPETFAQVTVACERVNFDLTVPDGGHRPMSLMTSGVWLEHVRISEFDRIRFKVDPAADEGAEAHLRDGSEVVIAQASSDGYVELMSSTEDDSKAVFSLRDIYVTPGVSISWAIDATGKRMLLEISQQGEARETSASFAPDARLRLGLFNCSFLDRNGRPLHDTEHDSREYFDFAMSFGSPQVGVTATSGRLVMELAIDREWLAEGTAFLRDLDVEAVDYSAKEYSSAGRPIHRNTVLAGSIRLPAYSLDDVIDVKKGDFITAAPSEGHLREVRADTSFLEVAVQYNCGSLKTGPETGAQHELVRSMLAGLLENRTLIVIYTAAMAVFSLLTNHLVKRNKEGG